MTIILFFPVLEVFAYYWSLPIYVRLLERAPNSLTAPTLVQIVGGAYGVHLR
jgi:hypothetical protein